MTEQQIVEAGGAVATTPLPAEVSKESIDRTVAQLRLVREMVQNILKRGVDFGRPAGQPADALWDSGAQLIISAFNGYVGERRVLKLEDTEDRITVILETPIISHRTGKVIGTGIGAASTKETKYKYRWVSEADAHELGYNPADLKKRQDKRREGIFVYQVPNPEHGELLNTLVKMASKRGEVDAAESLPTVASALRELFGKDSGERSAPEEPQRAGRPELYTYTQFWGDVRRMGITPADAYQALGVPHLKEWQQANANKTLRDALKIVRDWAIKQGMIEEGAQ